MEEVIQSILREERSVTETYFNGHSGEGNTGGEGVISKYELGERNAEG